MEESLASKTGSTLFEPININDIESSNEEVPFSYTEVIRYTNTDSNERDKENKNISSSYSSASTTKDYSIVWLDSNIDKLNEIYQNSILQLQEIIQSVYTFIEVDESIDFITQRNHKYIFMIISNELGQKIVHLMQDISQVKFIYVFCSERSNDKVWIEQCKKIKGVFTEMTYICNSINANIRHDDNYLRGVNSLLLINDPTRGLNELDQSFMYSQLLKDILLEMNHNDETKEMKELVEFLRDRYKNQNNELRSINDFEKNYNWTSSIKWYTTKYFIYSTLNEALRTQNINIIIKMGFFIRDLHRQINHLHLTSVDLIPATVYRGQALSTSDFYKLRNRKDGLLSFNNFLSTSTDCEISCTYAESNGNETDKTGVLFEIEVDRKISYASFATIGNLSQFAGEKEILFSMNTIFRIGDTEQITDCLWHVKLTLTNDNDEQLKRFTASLRKEIGEGNGWHQLGYLMIMLDKIDQAEEIYTRLLSQTSNDKRQNLAALNNQLGIISEKKGQYERALSFFQETCNIEEKFLSTNHPDLSTTYNNIAEIYHAMKNNLCALRFHQKALTIREQNRPCSDPLLAATHNNVARLYSSMGDYPNARLSAQEALVIAENCSFLNHPDMANIYDTVASVYSLFGDYLESLTFYQKALNIRQKTLPYNHASLLATRNNIASTFDSMGQYSNALEIYKEVLEYREKSLPSNHLDLALFYRNIGCTYNHMGDLTNALKFCRQALKIQKTSLSHNNLDIATTYNNIGQVYYNMKKYDKAISYYKKALDIDKEHLSVNHPDLAITYDNLGLAYQDNSENEKAFLNYQQALQIRKKSLPTNHPQLACSYNNLGKYYLNTREYTTAISHFEEAVKIHEEAVIPNLPELAIAYNNKGATYFSMEYYSKSLLFFRKALEIEQKSLGSDHPNLIYTYANIAYVLKSLEGGCGLK